MQVKLALKEGLIPKVSVLPLLFLPNLCLSLFCGTLGQLFVRLYWKMHLWTGLDEKYCHFCGSIFILDHFRDLINGAIPQSFITKNENWNVKEQKAQCTDS